MRVAELSRRAGTVLAMGTGRRHSTARDIRPDPSVMDAARQGRRGALEPGWRDDVHPPLGWKLAPQTEGRLLTEILTAPIPLTELHYQRYFQALRLFDRQLCDVVDGHLTVTDARMFRRAGQALMVSNNARTLVSNLNYWSKSHLHKCDPMRASWWAVLLFAAHTRARRRQGQKIEVSRDGVSIGTKDRAFWRPFPDAAAASWAELLTAIDNAQAKDHMNKWWSLYDDPLLLGQMASFALQAAPFPAATALSQLPGRGRRTWTGTLNIADLTLTATNDRRPLPFPDNLPYPVFHALRVLDAPSFLDEYAMLDWLDSSLTVTFTCGTREGEPGGPKHTLRVDPRTGDIRTFGPRQDETHVLAGLGGGRNRCRTARDIIVESYASASELVQISGWTEPQAARLLAINVLTRWAQTQSAPASTVGAERDDDVSPLSDGRPARPRTVP